MSVYFELIANGFKELFSIFEYAISRMDLGRTLVELVFIVAVYRFIITPLLHPSSLPSLGAPKDVKSEHKPWFGIQPSQKRIENKEK